MGIPSLVLYSYWSEAPSPGAVCAMALLQKVMLRAFAPHAIFVGCHSSM